MRSWRLEKTRKSYPARYCFNTGTVVQTTILGTCPQFATNGTDISTRMQPGTFTACFTALTEPGGHHQFFTQDHMLSAATASSGATLARHTPMRSVANTCEDLNCIPPLRLHIVMIAAG